MRHVSLGGGAGVGSTRGPEEVDARLGVTLTTAWLCRAARSRGRRGVVSLRIPTRSRGEGGTWLEGGIEREMGGDGAGKRWAALGGGRDRDSHEALGGERGEQRLEEDRGKEGGGNGVRVTVERC